MNGNRIGPMLIRSPELEEVFGHLARPGKVRALVRAAETNADARPLGELAAIASTQEANVRSFLTRPGPASGPHRPGPATGPDTPPDSPADSAPQEHFA